MLVSTFEILVKKQLPSLTSPVVPIPSGATKISRTVVQGYFLTISNINAFPVTVSLVFNAISIPGPAINPANTFVAVDVEGRNILGELVVDPGGRSARFPSLNIPANDTALFIFQPDILANNGALLSSADFELRGFVQVLAVSLSGNQSADLLLTPEHRGTFFGAITDSNPSLDQIAYSLPTANGGSLIRLSNL